MDEMETSRASSYTSNSTGIKTVSFLPMPVDTRPQTRGT